MRERTVLIIDDERRMADSLRDLLAPLGYRCQTAYGGREGLERLRRDHFHLVLTDLRMHDLDGLALLRFIGDNAPRTLTVILTAYASAESAIEAIHLGVFDYVRKPYDFDQLLQLIERAFARLEAEQLREDTAAMITHDLKIPLTSIIGFASMIYDRERREFHPRAREFAEGIQTNGQKILAMIDNYLTTCKIEAGTLQITPCTVDLRQLINDVVETASLTASRRGHGIELDIGDIPETLDMDEPLVYRAIGNLLHNAIKYGDNSRPIRLHARRLQAAESPLGVASVRIATTNAAALQSPNDLAGIFQRYKRTTGSSGIEGAGLGLYVVQAIVRAHGGEATAEILDGGLVRFAIDLPIHVAD